MINNIENILKTFEPISLKDLGKVKLLNRVDTKFTFHIDKIQEILEHLTDSYRILEIENIRINQYESLYFDTIGLNLYHNHHNGRLNRFKVRYRCYKDSDLSFFEIKLKNNKNRTIKERIRRNHIEEVIQDDAKIFLMDKTSISSDDLNPMLWVYYSRITLVNKSKSERLTFDINLTYKYEKRSATYPKLVIAELKQEKSSNSMFLKMMKDRHIRKIAMSKYCFGIINLHSNIKMNNFKTKLLHLKKTVL